MRKICISGNWKMNQDSAQTEQFFHNFNNYNKADNVEVRIFPSFLSIEKALASSNGVVIGAQNFHCEESGAYTGEVSLAMLAELGVKNVLVGHSERRSLFAEDNEFLNKKVHAALEKSFKVTFCIGETLKERNTGKLEVVLTEQIKQGLVGVCVEQFQDIIIAYEPVWAIGTGVTATSEQAQDTHKFVRSVIIQEYGKTIADNMIIQYGGSVKPNNIEELISQPDIDGALIGGASLAAKDLKEIVAKVSC